MSADPSIAIITKDCPCCGNRIRIPIHRNEVKRLAKEAGIAFVDPEYNVPDGTESEV